MDTSTEGGFAKITFGDNGVGIGDANLKKIFEPLFTTKPGGSGFGLAVCQEIIEKHGGTISATHNADGEKGSIFTVKLPIS